MLLSRIGRVTLGLIVLALVIIIFVASGVAIQLIFTNGDYRKPLALTVYSLTLAALLLPIQPLLGRCRSESGSGNSDGSECRDHSTAARWPRKRYVCLLGVLWFAAQLTYNTSLLYTSVATNSSLSSSSAIFTFIFSIVILRYPLLRVVPILATLLCVSGVVVTAINQPKPDASSAVRETPLGYVLALGSACCYGVFTCCLKRWVLDEGRMVYVFGMFGVIALIIGVPSVIVCHFTGLEKLVLPTWAQWGAITANAIIGSVVSDYMLSVAVILLSPLVVSLGLAMTIPLSLLADGLILRLHTFKAIYLLGAALVFTAVGLISWDTYRVERKREKATERDSGTEVSTPEERRQEEGVRTPSIQSG
ncbi:hypothetical protein FOZ62_028635 [Perkinsus olseni]|uniref:EamA domain-containing protein n=1 Tax=Perkinsus olseni TaxID=32597 RepID=A0A7J6T7J7_PEROL|nr:hypothetical protein FOZ62_028635 [Perkinsus olseni]